MLWLIPLINSWLLEVPWGQKLQHCCSIFTVYTSLGLNGPFRGRLALLKTEPCQMRDPNNSLWFGGLSLVIDEKPPHVKKGQKLSLQQAQGA